MKTDRLRKVNLIWMLSVFILLLTTSQPAALAQGKWCPGPDNQGKWWEVEPEPEVPSAFYDSMLYSEIGPRLYEVMQTSDRIKVRVIGKSAGGRNLFLTAVTAPGEEGRFGHYKQLRRLMIRDPEQALALIDQFDDFKVPVFINGSIHGDEYPGTDACMRLIETLAYENSEEIQAVLDNIILLINVVHNPDGRVLGTRENAARFDLNRDMITQCQPETRAVVRAVADWNPMVFLDLHGFIEPMLIEPCTPPHNPNYEYDLYLKWALLEAQAMAEELYARTDETEVIIPYLNWPDGWDDWSPTYAAMYPMLHGAYGHTLETPHEDSRGVDAHYAAVWGALKFVVANKKAMIHDQVEIYRRGLLDMPQTLIPEDLLNETPWDQFNDLTIKDFPQAYLIPDQAPRQQNPVQAAGLIEFMLDNGVQVEKAVHNFAYDGVDYSRGTYVVWMNQPKRALANTILETGLDVSAIEDLIFYSPPAAWSHPLLWGVSRTIADQGLTVHTRPVKQAAEPHGSLQPGRARAYAFDLTTLPAFQGINTLIDHGYPLYRAKQAFSDRGRLFRPGTIVMPPDRHAARRLKQKYKLTIAALHDYPENLVILEKQRIAVHGDEGLRYCLGQLGFDFDGFSAAMLNAGPDLSGYDLFIFNYRFWPLTLEPAAIQAIRQFCINGGDFIGLGYGGATLAARQELIEMKTEFTAGNGIVAMDLDTDSSLAAGFAAREYGFVFSPVWFSMLGEGVASAARLTPENTFLAGYWPDWQQSPALGQPIMVFEDAGLKDTVVMGIDATFRGHPRNSFKLVGNAIFSGLDKMKGNQ